MDRWSVVLLTVEKMCASCEPGWTAASLPRTACNLCNGCRCNAPWFKSLFFTMRYVWREILRTFEEPGLSMNLLYFRGRCSLMLLYVAKWRVPYFSARVTPADCKNYKLLHAPPTVNVNKHPHWEHCLQELPKRISRMARRLESIHCLPNH